MRAARVVGAGRARLDRVMSVHDLSILIIDENRLRASIIEDGLREAGHCLLYTSPSPRD